MNIEDKLIKELKKHFPDCEIGAEKGEDYNGIYVTKDGKKSGFNYRDIEEKDIPVIVEKVIDKLDFLMKNGESLRSIIERKNYDNIIPSLVYKNKVLNDEVVSMDYYDMKLIFTILSEEYDYGIHMTNSILKYYELSKDELLEIAVKNFAKINYQIETLKDKIQNLTSNLGNYDELMDVLYGNDCLYPGDDIEDTNIWVISNDINKAGTYLLDKAVLNEACNVIGTGRIFVIPESYESLLVCDYYDDSINIDYIVDNKKEVNNGPIGMMLTEHIFIFDRIKGKLEIYR